ncbi:hypothetical protein NM688_g6847 [Phlebia brevispora]|uniref:Uncharacterized protein n=1 Tax=Phlebia brevispora TaxID=194682 RepID=A0ACC1SBT5_9APHY|nr:hypothetical protein NM688_g6847 [Phlebia brevispora]
MCSVPPSILANQTIAAQYCTQTTESCFAICANPDISGIGVRASFYAQSVISAMLVILSPRDSVPAAWAGTLLTSALIIAAIIQKANQSLSLHHAVLIMNFATLSCISSLATAPKLPLWRLRTDEYIAQKLVPRTDFQSMNLNLLSQQVGNILSKQFSSQAKLNVKNAQMRERLIFVLSLSAQVLLQWTWGIILFVSPEYSQQSCSEQTKLFAAGASTSSRDTQTPDGAG